MKFEGIDRIFKLEPGCTYLIVTRPTMTYAQHIQLSKNLSGVSEQNKFVLVSACVVKDVSELTEFLIAKGITRDS